MATGRIIEILGEAKKLAREYRALSGKPLGITGEVAEHEAAVHFGVELAVAREAGDDATEVRDGVDRRLQIKGRCVLEDSKRGQSGPQLWLRSKLREAGRGAERGALSVSRFRAIGTLRWKRPTPITLEQMDELVRFLPVFDSPGPETEPRWSGLDQKPTDGVFVMPYPTYPPVVDEFFALASQEWWNDPSYASSGASDQVGSDRAIAAASLSQIRSMLTFCARGERFCDGHWAEMVKTGRIGAILRRLEHLRSETADAKQNAAAQVGYGAV